MKRMTEFTRHLLMLLAQLTRQYATEMNRAIAASMIATLWDGKPDQQLAAYLVILILDTALKGLQKKLNHKRRKRTGQVTVNGRAGVSFNVRFHKYSASFLLFTHLYIFFWKK